MQRIVIVCLLLLGQGFFMDSQAWVERNVLHIDLPQTIVLGEPFFLGMRSPVHFKKVRIDWLDTGMSVPLKFKNQAYAAHVLLGTDVKRHTPGMKTVRVQAEKYGITRVQERVIRVRDRQAPVQNLTVSKDKVALSQAALDRHQREQQAVRKVLSRISPGKMWSCPFQRPAAGDISSAYGLKRVLNGKPRSPHRGLDIRSGDQAPVTAANAGLVVLTADHFFAGKSVYIDHGQGVISMYFHLSSIAVQTGQHLAKGEFLGRTGSTGRATGPHLHFGISLGRALVNPEPLLGDACPRGF